MYLQALGFDPRAGIIGVAGWYGVSARGLIRHRTIAILIACSLAFDDGPSRVWTMCIYLYIKRYISHIAEQCKSSVKLLTKNHCE